jgi:hypothetical protein
VPTNCGTRVTRADLHSHCDDIAARVVDSGGGIEAIVEATDLRTRENVHQQNGPGARRATLER